jgi:hypothetical protein
MSRGKCLGIHHSDSVRDTPTERLGFTGKTPCADSPRENGRKLTPHRAGRTVRWKGMAHGKRQAQREIVR